MKTGHRHHLNTKISAEPSPVLDAKGRKCPAILRYRINCIKIREISKKITCKKGKLNPAVLVM